MQIRGTRCAVVAVLLAACGGETQAPKEASPPVRVPTAGAVEGPPIPAVPTPPATGRRVCCESFGYGARMVECCAKAAWTSPDDCRIPPGFVGGGKRIVDDAKCAGN